MLQVDHITRSFDGQPVLRGLSLDVKRGEIVCLLGPSGCGKTTLLRIIAGLERADGGDVILNGKTLMSMQVHQRDFGLMFQDFALFPHMNVYQNVAFGLRMHQAPMTENRVQELLQLVGLKGYDQRDVTSLSGGERQRVALARSLATNPRLLMLDEPLGSLDAALRQRLVLDLRRIIKRVGLTAIYVTHDQREAFAIADRIAVMNSGRSEQIDRPELIYFRPETEFVARFLGLDNIVPVLERGDYWIKTPLGDFTSPSQAVAYDRILLHPSGIRVTDENGSNAMTAEVVTCVFAGDGYDISLQHESGFPLSLRVSAYGQPIPQPGSRVNLRIDPAMIVPLKGD